MNRHCQLLKINVQTADGKEKLANLNITNQPHLYTYLCTAVYNEVSTS